MAKDTSISKFKSALKSVGIKTTTSAIKDAAKKVGSGGGSSGGNTPAPAPALTYAPGSLETMTVDQATKAGKLDEYNKIVKGFSSAVSTSDADRNDTNLLDNDIKGMEDKVNGENVTLPDGTVKTNNNNLAIFDQRSDELREDYKAETERIKADYESSREGLEDTQRRETGATQAGILRMGGYLGESGSGTGVMLTQAKQQRGEVQSLLSQRDKFLAEARTAYNKDNFDVARAKLDAATKAEESAYQRSQDYFKNQMILSNFNMDKAEKVLTALSYMDEDDISKPDTLEKIAEVDSIYYPGFASSYVKTAKAEREAESTKDKLAIDAAYISMLSDIPYGQTVVLPNGKAYTGMKTSKTDSSGPNVPLTLNKATAIGLPPGVVGRTEGDIIFDLELTNPPTWYVQMKAPELSKMAYTGSASDIIKNDWNAFRDQPDVQAFRNTVQLNYRVNKPSGSGDDTTTLLEQLQANIKTLEDLKK